jgi:Calcineurin-like phosphoesterase
VIPREVFERKRVLLQAQRIRDFVDRELQRGQPGLSLGEHHVDRSELVELRRRVDAALKQASREPASAGAAAAYVPRNPTLSNLQSLAANRLTVNVPVARAPHDEEVASLLEGPPVVTVARADAEPTAAREVGTGTQTLDPVTAFSVAERVDDALGLASRSGLRGEDERLPEPYGPDDPLWLTIALAIAFRKYEDYELGKLPFNSSPATAALGERARLFILGDWGTGTERAQRVANAIHAKLRDSDSRGRDCHVIHLGDTYVAGWWWEQLLHVIRLWPVRGGVQATSWALAGNHDYYSGTDGYFDLLLGHPPFAHQHGDGRPTSIFELRNDHWCVLGLDSSWVDHDLPQAEVSWLDSALDRAEHQGQRVILLTHHQPWSAFGEGPHPPLWKRVVEFWSRLEAWLAGRRGDVTPLWKKVKPLIESRPVAAWFWGHEHRFALYKPRREINRPRLLGNGGVPSHVTDASYYTHPDLLAFDYEAPLPDDPEWCRFAFAIVDLDDDGFSETYFDEYGAPIRT